MEYRSQIKKFYILDDEMRECPDWVKGRIYISGKGLALGYFKDDSLTCRKFVFHKELEERLYDTGDMGRYRTDGVIEFFRARRLSSKNQRTPSGVE